MNERYVQWLFQILTSNKLRKLIIQICHMLTSKKLLVHITLGVHIAPSYDTETLIIKIPFEKLLIHKSAHDKLKELDFLNLFETECYKKFWLILRLIVVYISMSCCKMELFTLRNARLLLLIRWSCSGYCWFPHFWHLR